MCLPMAWETSVQSQIKSFQRLKKWYLMLPCLTLSIIRYESRVKWSNPGNGIVLSPTPWCSSYWKGNLQVALDYGHQLYFYIYKSLSSFFDIDHTESLDSLSLSLSLSIPIVYIFWQIFKIASSVCTEVIYISLSSWLALVHPCVEVHWRTSLMSSSYFSGSA